MSISIRPFFHYSWWGGGGPSYFVGYTVGVTRARLGQFACKNAHDCYLEQRFKLFSEHKRRIRNCNRMDRRRRSDKEKIFCLLIYGSRLSYIQIFSSRSLPQRPTQDYYKKKSVYLIESWGFYNSKGKRKTRLRIRYHKSYLLLGHRPKSYYKCLSKGQLTNSLHSNSGKWKEWSRSLRPCQSRLIQIQISSRSRSQDATDQIVAAISQPLCQQSDRVKDVMYHVAHVSCR
jgi:hypothetical protein